MLALLATLALAAPATPAVDPALAERFARLALACVHQEYPNKIAHVLSSDADVRPPRELTPAFFGSPGVVTDPSDPKLAHLDGLNLSRAWMLEGVAAGLPTGDPRAAALRAAAAVHREKGLAAVTGEHYEGGHWLGTFAVYLVTLRGLR